MKNGVKLAIFDSNKSNRLLIESISKQVCKNITFLSATDGIEAMELIGKKKIDICFINLSLPVISGTEIAKILKDKDNETIIIALNSIGLDSETINNGIKFNAIIDIGNPSTVKLIKEQITNFIYN